MKKLFLFFFILVFLQVTTFSQSCLPEGITFSTQDEIDSFQVNYPGCTSIEGEVKINGNDISNLAGLNVLDSVLGKLDIGGGYDLIDLSGLESLKFIGESLNVDYCEYLRYFSGLNNLTTINGSLHIEFNDRLTSITGLQNLSSVGALSIFANEELVSFSGLGNLDSITWDLSIISNYMLSSLDGLASLAKIDGEIVISFNESLAILSGLEGLTSIGDALRIYENHSLVSLSGLDNVNPASLGIIEIWHNPLLSDCDIQCICNYLSDPMGIIAIYENAEGCNNPHEIADSCGFALPCLPYGNYYFLSQANVDSFPSYYPDCHRLEGYVDINGGNITNLDSLIGIDTIVGTLHICGNNNLLSLNGLGNLRYIQDDLNLGYWECGSNPKLTNLTGLYKLTTVGRWMLLLGNSGLLSLSGLDSLTSVGQEFGIYDSPLLKNLNGISRLDSVQSLWISGNDSMISLDGIQSLTHAGYITIQYNPMLITLDGIENIDAVHLIGLNIHDNDSLTECNVRSVCDFLINYSGLVDIYNNNTGCDSAQEVELACGVGIEEVSSRQSTVSSHPNPFSYQVTFDIRLQDPAKVNMVIYNNLGQIVATILDESLKEGDHLITWNTENLPPGIYFYRLSTFTCQLSTSGKMVVVR